MCDSADMGEDGGKAIGGRTLWDLVKSLWDALVQHWSGWSLAMKAMLVLFVVAIVCIAALANWGPPIKGLFSPRSAPTPAPIAPLPWPGPVINNNASVSNQQIGNNNVQKDRKSVV